jgi:SAM-dependent methyltransferase
VAVSDDDVISVYRALLKRDPESEEVIKSKVANFSTLEALIKAFLESAEFRRKSFPISSPLWPDEVIESLSDSEEDANKQLQRTISQWQHLGETDPFWSVLTDERFRMSNFSDHEDEFWNSGISEVEKLDTKLEELGLSLSGQHCLELGCGTGRLTGPLLRRYSKVTGVDISEGNLSICEDRLRDTNAEFLLLRELSDLKSVGEVDGVFSLITLQHNLPSVQISLLRILLASLKPGGLAVFQIAIRGYNYYHSSATWLDRERIMDIHVLPISNVLRVINDLSLDCADVIFDGRTGSGYLSATLIVTKPR